jgi:hypothetical protein
MASMLNKIRWLIKGKNRKGEIGEKKLNYRSLFKYDDAKEERK